MTYALFLKKYWKQTAVFVTAVLLCLYIFNLRTTNAQQAAEIAKHETANLTLKLNNERLTSALETVNSAITDVGKQTASTQARLDKLSTQLSKRQGSLDQRLADLLKQPVPQTCHDAIELLRKGAQS